jgi:uncharacterized membrane protein
VIARALVMLAILWPAAAAAAVVSEARTGSSVWTDAVRLVGSRICHQRADRSFHSAGVVWPVCARCSGLYLGGAASAWLGLLVVAFRASAQVRRLLLLAGVPTILTWIAEWMFALPISNVVRFTAAVPLGAAIAFAIVQAASGRPRSIE